MYIQCVDMTIVDDGLCNLHTSAVEATLQISSTCYEKQTKWYSENTSITTIIQLASGNNSLGWPSPIQNITRFAFSYLSKSKATIKCTYTGSKMNMLRFKQREKEKETISIQINVGNPDQIFHPVWEEMGKGWKLINQILQFLLKLKHFCTFGTDTPPYLSCSIHYLLPIPKAAFIPTGKSHTVPLNSLSELPFRDKPLTQLV